MEDLKVRVAYANTVLNDIQNYTAVEAHARYAADVRELLTVLQNELESKGNVTADVQQRLERMKKNRDFWFERYLRMSGQRDKAQAESIQRGDEVAALKERLDAEAQLVAELREKLARAEHQIDTFKLEKGAIAANLEQTRGDFERARWMGINVDIQNAAELEALRDQHRYACETLRTISEALDRKSERIGELERCVNEAMKNVRKEQHAHAETKQKLAEAKSRVLCWTGAYHTEFAAHTKTKQQLTETKQQLTDAHFQAHMAWEAWNVLAKKVS